MRYKKVYDGEWVRPVRKGYKMKCCDCGLVHKIDFKLIKWGRGKKILFRAIRVRKSMPWNDFIKLPQKRRMEYTKPGIHFVRK